MIYITGDIHGSIDIAKILPENWNESEKLTRSDYLIICGDLAFLFCRRIILSSTLQMKTH